MAREVEVGDLIVLVPDTDTLVAIRVLLSRHLALGVRPLRFEVVPHPEHDPGCWLRGPELLRGERSRFSHALVQLDREGCGRDDEPRDVLESDLERRLARDWGDRAAAVVVDPELEAWVWSDSPHVEDALGWRGRSPDLQSWLTGQGLLGAGATKPSAPKTAVEKALRVARRPRSSSIYADLASRVSFQRCEDPAFRKLCAILKRWFPA